MPDTHSLAENSSVDLNQPHRLATLRTLKVTTRLAQLVGAVAIVVFAPFALLALGSGNITSALLFIVFAVVGGALIPSASGVIEMDAKAITLRRRDQCHRICWDEVISIEKAGDTLIFNGEEKCLVLIEPLWWRGRARKPMLEMLSQQIAQRKLPVRSNLLATFKRSRNTRITETVQS